MTNSGCRKAIDLMSGAVDGVLSPRELLLFDGHIERCGSCRREFELEKSTKSYFKAKVGLLEPPADLLETIRSRLSYEDALRMERPRAGRPRLRILLWPALAISLAMIFVVVNMYSRKQRTVVPESSRTVSAVSEPVTKDALVLSDRNFQNLLTGKFLPQMRARDAGDMTAFLKERAGYSIQLPAVRDPEWIGGSVTTSGGEKVVDVAYRVGGSYIYIHAFPTSLAHSDAITLPRECIRALDNDRWYWNRGSKGDLQVTWMDGGRVCVATSNLTRKDLAAYLNAPKEDD